MLTSSELSGLLDSRDLAPAAALVAELARDGSLIWTAQHAPMSPISPASLIKVPIVAALARRFECGLLEPDMLVPIDASNVTTNDAASPFAAGGRARLDDLGRQAIVRSDNIATNVLIDVLGRENIDAFCRHAGLLQTFVRRKLSGSLPLIADPGATGRNAHPAGDAALLFAAIARRGPADWLFSALAAQEWNEKLAAGLAPGDRFAHKTGDHDEACHDGGILETAAGRRFVIVVYVALASSPAVDARLAELMRALRPHLEG